MYHIKLQSPSGGGPAFLQKIITVRERPKVYGWTANPAEAMQMDADKAICIHGEIAAIPHHGEIVTIVPVAKNLFQQLRLHQISALASMLGAVADSGTFIMYLERTAPLPHGFALRDAALAYIDTVRASLVAADPEARQ